MRNCSTQSSVLALHHNTHHNRTVLSTLPMRPAGTAASPVFALQQHSTGANNFRKLGGQRGRTPPRTSFVLSHPLLHRGSSVPWRRHHRHHHARLQLWVRLTGLETEVALATASRTSPRPVRFSGRPHGPTHSTTVVRRRQHGTKSKACSSRSDEESGGNEATQRRCTNLKQPCSTAGVLCQRLRAGKRQRYGIIRPVGWSMWHQRALQGTSRGTSARTDKPPQGCVRGGGR